MNQSKGFFTTFFENKKPHVKEAVIKLVLSKSSGPASTPKLAGFVLDMYCTCMIDVGNEFEVSSYLFYSSGAAYLGFTLHTQALHDEQNKLTPELRDLDAELVVPSLVNPLPVRVLHPVFLDKGKMGMIKNFRRVKGIMVNTFAELGPCGITSFNGGKTPFV